MGKRVRNRREFLAGRSTVDAVEDLVDGIRKTSPDPNSPRENLVPDSTARVPSYLLELTRDAMAVEFQVLLNAGEFAHGTAAAIAALDLVEQLEAQLTVYRDTSEVSRINERASVSPIQVEARLFRLLQLAQRIALETDGAYDLTSGPLTKLWGFYRREGRMPGDAEIVETLQHIGHRLIEFDDARRTVRFTQPGVEINLGGIGKGHALDRMSETLIMENVTSFLLHGGQSSVLARGSRNSERADDGWLVGLAHPLRSDARLAEFRLVDRALGTSGSGTQFFHHQGRKYGHILDPRTGRPADRVLSSTVLAPSAAEADALSTAFYVGGVELANHYCSTHPLVAAVLVSPESRAGGLRIETFNLREEDWCQSRNT